MRDLSLRVESYLPSPPLKTSFESRIRSANDYCPIPKLASDSSSLSLNWSVADVAQFIENNFPEKNLARVNEIFLFFFFIFVVVYSIEIYPTRNRWKYITIIDRRSFSKSI
jgi:hypothetical protein